jgi:hypothetical protein
MGLMNSLKEQEVVDLRLIITLLVVGVLGVGVFVWIKVSGGDSTIGDTENTYYCHFDDAKVNVSNADFYTWRSEGNAIMNDRESGCPARVRCPECNRMSCFKLDRETGEEIAVSEDWDLSENATEPQRGGPR